MSAEENNIEELKEDPNKSEEIKERPIIVYVATLPNEQGIPPQYLDYLCKHFFILHPCYNYEDPSLAHTFEELELPQPPESNLVLRDTYGIENCDIFVYDLDANPGLQFFQSAVIYQKPIFAISQTLRGGPAYYSAFIKAIVKPDDLTATLNLLLKSDKVETK